jgi:hypothetical protein
LGEVTEAGRWTVKDVALHLVMMNLADCQGAGTAIGLGCSMTLAATGSSPPGSTPTISGGSMARAG